MNLAETTINNKLLSTIFILLILIAGWQAYLTMPRFEDPEFTIRTAIVSASYPGATPLEVAEEMAEPLESAIQQLQEVEEIRTIASAGKVEISVDIDYRFSKTKADLQLVWTKLRNKLKDAERLLPPGAGPVLVNDDFGDVYGFYYLLTADGYTFAELEKYAEELRDELLLLDGVAKVAILGTQQEAIYVEIPREVSHRLGKTLPDIYNQLNQQNNVVSAGDMQIEDRRMAISPSGGIDSVEAMRNLLVSVTGDNKGLYLGDIAAISRGYVDPPRQLIRYNGQPALALGIANTSGANVVEVGKIVARTLEKLEPARPIGMTLHEFYNQGKVVDSSVQDFLLNVIAALVIVIVTLFLFMGLRSAAIIGSILLLTVAATLSIMNVIGIPMHRISLGSLIIALGMMVDNAIVVTEGILVGVQKGKDRLTVVRQIVAQSKWPLLGGTLVGILAFAPIGFAPGSTAEYTNHLFWVILISLLCSWLLALTLTPLFCYLGFRLPPASQTEATPAAPKSAILAKYEGLLSRALRYRRTVLAATIGIFAISIYGFQFVQQSFFPNSTTPQVVVDYWLPEGTDISRTAEDAKQIEEHLLQQNHIEGVQTLIGAGGLRYMLVYGPESPNSSYAQLLVRVDDYKNIGALLPAVQSYLDTTFPEAQTKVWRFSLGPGGGSKIEAEFTGPDPAVLRNLAGQAAKIMRADSKTLTVKQDWRQPVSYIEPVYSEANARRAGISREDLADAIKYTFSGQRVGKYREGDKLLPIIARAPEEERRDADAIRYIQILSPTTGMNTPITEVTDGFSTQWRNGILKKQDRQWMIKAQCDPVPGVLASSLLQSLRPQIENIELPQGYRLSWGGEYGDSSESQENLASTIPYGLLAMVLVVIILFRRIRQPLIIWLVVPLALTGVSAGLLLTGIPLDFMGILGVLSLSGLLIKNAIVLVDQMDIETREFDGPKVEALLAAAASRFRPVMLGTLTTVLGVVPLFFDAFFQAMAVVLVFGLLFATLLTLVVLPLLYSLFLGIHPAKS